MHVRKTILFTALSLIILIPAGLFGITYVRHGLYERFAGEGGFYYRKMTAFHVARLRQLQRPVPWFLGDSHVQRFCSSCYFPGALNLGIGGDTTRGLLARVETAYAPWLGRASVFVVLIGANDYKYYAPADTAQYLQRLVDRLGQSAPVLLIVPPYVSRGVARESGQTTRTRVTLHMLNAACAGSSQPCRVVQISDLQDAEGFLPTDMAAVDGKHLNAKAYGRLVAFLRPVMADMQAQSVFDR